jgi:hypothetical protein
MVDGRVDDIEEWRGEEGGKRIGSVGQRRADAESERGRRAEAARGG